MTTPFQSSASTPSAYGDDLAAVVVRRLEKRSGGGSWGLLKTLLLGVPSFGLIPLLAWPARFRDFAADETHAMQELAQWAKLRGRQPAAVGPLIAAAEDTAASPLPFVLALTLAALIVGVFAIQIAHVQEFSIACFLDWTYSFDSRFSATSPLAQRDFVYRVWVVALSLGFAVQWFSIRMHAADVKRFVERFNPVAEAEGLHPVRIPSGGFGYFRPLWILAAVMLSYYGAWWGIPMVLAGIAQSRYTNLTGRRVRQLLATRVKDVVAIRQTPALFMPRVTARCTNPRCMAQMRSRARFCTRCGSAVPESA